MAKQFLSSLFLLVFAALSVLLPGCVAQENEPVAGSTEELHLTEVKRSSFDIPIGHGDSIFTRVAYRPVDLLRPRQLVVLVPGTLANGGGYYDIASGTGYNTMELLANEGYIVAALDLLGTGENERFEDGSVLGTEVAADAVGRAAHVLRLLFLASDVFVYGETGLGSNICLMLAREPWVSGIIVASPFYIQFGPIGALQLFDPAQAALLQSIPGGYLPLAPETFGPFLFAAPPAIATEATVALLGPAPSAVPVAPLLEPFEHTGPDSIATGRLATPIVTAESAIAPALFIQGDPDPLGSVEGAEELVADYGGDAELVVIAGATHLMRFDAVISDGPTSQFWSPILTFLDTH
ncbi:alpha/beta fold hydrolase [Candidatus Uhrbacteria bacterium]|nr:alpha/beta fold hydrolase [Candidatus Uhrbacteria bacterium]